METNNEPRYSLLPKWVAAGLGILLMLFVLLLIVQKANDLKNTIKNAKPANTISVSGEGKVTATPDLATVMIGVTTQGVSAADVKNQNNGKINQVIDFIKSQGVDAKDITTSQLSLYPQQDYTNGTAKIIGYQGNQTITVKMHGIDKSQDQLGKVLDGAVNAGANQVNGVNLTFENPNDLQQQARKMAIDDAKKKATELAAQAGLSLGKVVSISEANTATPGPIPYGLGMGGGPALEKSVAPAIEPGSQDITEDMTVTFEVK